MLGRVVRPEPTSRVAARTPWLRRLRPPWQGDWMAAAMPTLRFDTTELRALDCADRQPPTCRPDTTLGSVTTPLLVVNCAGIVLGRVLAGQYSDGTEAEEIMEP